MDFCEGIDKPTLQNAIDLLQASVDDDFQKQMRNQAMGSHYFQDVGATLPGFTSGVDMRSVRVTIHPSFFKR